MKDHAPFVFVGVFCVVMLGMIGAVAYRDLSVHFRSERAIEACQEAGDSYHDCVALISCGDQH